MKYSNGLESQTARRILLVACSTALALGFTVSLPKSAHAARVTPPAVPDKIKVPEGKQGILEGHGFGTQNYICLPAPTRRRLRRSVPTPPASPGYSSRPRPRCSTTKVSSPPPTSSAPTRMRTVRFGPRGCTRGTRAPSGEARQLPLPSAPSSTSTPFPGSSFRWLESKRGRPVVTR